MGGIFKDLHMMEREISLLSWWLWVARLWAEHSSTWAMMTLLMLTLKMMLMLMLTTIVLMLNITDP